MVERAIKTEDELMALLRDALPHQGLPLQGAQWIKIVHVEPATNGANWTVLHSGEPGGHWAAIEAAQVKLKQHYDLEG